MRLSRCRQRHGSRICEVRLRAHALFGRFLPRLGPLAARWSGPFRGRSRRTPTTTPGSCAGSWRPTPTSTCCRTRARPGASCWPRPSPGRAARTMSSLTRPQCRSRLCGRSCRACWSGASTFRRCSRPRPTWCRATLSPLRAFGSPERPIGGCGRRATILPEPDDAGLGEACSRRASPDRRPQRHGDRPRHNQRIWLTRD